MSLRNATSPSTGVQRGAGRAGPCLAAGLVATALALVLACGRDEICHARSCAPCPPEGCPSAAGVIYRSVGPGRTSAVASGAQTGAGLLRVRGSVAVFDGALPADVGVGDALVATFGGVTSLAFVSARRDATAFELQTADGGAPPDQSGPSSVWYVFRAHTSLVDAADRTPNAAIPSALAQLFDRSSTDLVAQRRIWAVACYADDVDSADERDAYFERWNTSAEYYLRIYTPTDATEVGVSQRHRGVLDPPPGAAAPGRRGYMLHKAANRTNGFTGMLKLLTQYARVEGLQLWDTATASSDVALAFEPAGDGEVQISGTLIFGNPANTETSLGIVLYTAEAHASTVIAHGNVIVGWSRAGFAVNAYPENPLDGGLGAWLFGNTFDGSPMAFETGSARVVALNNAMRASTRCVNETEPVDPISDHNLCSLAESMTGASSRAGVTPAWVDPSGGDYHLSPADTVAAGAGVDLSGVASYLAWDFDGQWRTGAWDVGADQR